MKKINKASILPNDLLDKVVSRKKKENKKRLQGMKNKLKILYDEYADKANKGVLHTLSSQWVYDKTKTDSEGYFLYHQYDNSTKSMADLQTKIIEANGGKIVLKCPICELRETSDMDHYAPRQLFPEYSIHAYNLIPICHQCNNDKSNLWCEEGKRLIFNAYYDTPTDEPIFDIRVQENNGILSIGLSLKTFVNPKEETRLALSTISKLGLIPFINYKVNEMFCKRIEEIIRLRSNFSGTFDEFWAMECGALTDNISSIDDVNDFDRIVCTTVKDSPLVKTWLIDYFKY